MNHGMIRTTAAAVLLTVSFATTAAAADLCIAADSGSWVYVFRKAKKLKPAGAVPLTGIYISGGSAAPVTGTAMANADGTIRVGIHVSRMAIGSVNYNETAVLNASYAGPSSYDTDNDGSADGASVWAAIDCDTVTVP